MAKAFYSLEEVCEQLGKSQDEIKEMVASGALREFRDAGKIFFKAEDVNKLSGAGESASEDSGELELAPADEPAEAPAEVSPTTAESEGEGTSVIGLEAIDEEEPAPAPPPAPEPEPASLGLEDSGLGLAVDGGSDEGGATSGIGVFDDDELDIDADPMAETQITAGPAEDQVSLEGTGSGSGLLDLTREADDTSLGAELLDEIYPGEEEAEAVAEAEPVAEAEEVEAAEEAEPEEAEEATAEPEPVAVAAAPAMSYAVAYDPSEGLFTGLLVGALILICVAGSVVASTLQGFFPGYGKMLTNNFWFFLGGAAAVPLLSLVIGWVIGRAGGSRR